MLKKTIFHKVNVEKSWFVCFLNVPFARLCICIYIYIYICS